jgi:cation diffusion facilitator CzcD-associated flavoprotein CzcO
MLKGKKNVSPSNCINGHFSTAPLQFDLVVVGGGIVGCATARQIKMDHPQLSIALVEKESKLGTAYLLFCNRYFST